MLQRSNCQSREIESEKLHLDSMPLARWSPRSFVSRHNMLARSSLAPASALRRGMKTDALSRLQLDINAAHNSLQESFREPASPVEKSPKALRGESLRGDVQLPRELQEAVDKAIQGDLPQLLCSGTRI